ncbi:MAG TPA: ThiF family adenylyltransferase [Candidatus Nitrosocosmicus sp.]|nr:ThiF family adenylyltransferase [Candidatus Nitrosocosmicus sp.]
MIYKLATVEFVIPSVLNKGSGEKKLSIDASTLDEAFNIASNVLGDDFKRRVIDLNGKPRALINIYINGKNIRFNNTGMNSALNDGDSVYILPAVAGGAEMSSKDMIRYSRQIMLEEIGYVGMEKLKDAKICVVGAGGIGNPVVTQLVGMGIGKIRLVDRDVVEISNLHRQHLYTDLDVGKVKVEAALERLQKMNPGVDIEAIPISVTPFTAEDIIRDCNIVIDALDSIDARYALNDACLKLGIPFIYGGAIGMVGSVCTILPYESACLRCIFPELSEEEMPTCSTEGVHPSILYLVAGAQVSEAIKIVVGQQPSLVNKLLYIDLNDLVFDKIQMYRHDECSSCGRNAIKKPIQAPSLMVEELCGRDRGKRTYTVTPAQIKNDVNLLSILKNAESQGYAITSRGNLGITFSNQNKLLISFLTSGAATIVGAKDKDEALDIYKSFTNGLKIET